MSYRCPVCRASIANWLINKEPFECPDCKTILISNSKKALRQSLIVALVVWIMVLIGVQHYSGSWVYAVVVSIEAGGILAAILAVFYYRLAVQLKKQIN